MRASGAGRRGLGSACGREGVVSQAAACESEQSGVLRVFKMPTNTASEVRSLLLQAARYLMMNSLRY